jgi:hypothetical protein
VSATALPRRDRSARPRPRRRPTTAPRPPLTRARPHGRAASTPSYLIVTVVACLLGLVVTLQIEALRDNIRAGRIDHQVQAQMTANINLRAQIAQLYPRPLVDAFAAKNGMVLAPPSAYQQLQLPVSTPRG